MSTIMGVHDGHNASVALLRDGVLEFALQEERLSRIKNQGDAPAGSARLAQEKAGSSTYSVALNGYYMNYGQWQRETILADYSACSNLKSRLKQPFKGTIVDRAYQRRKGEERRRRLTEAGIPAAGQKSVDHHLAHASAAYYLSPWASRASTDRVLVFTCDGSGDRLCATVSIGESGRLQRIAQVSEHDSIGRLYALVTRHLSMVPLEHEYKVMGLAPYVSNASSPSIASRFQQLFQFRSDGMGWQRKRGVRSMYAAYGLVRHLLENERFDACAAGIQLFLERMLTSWIANAIRETGIARIACSGGVFMNVKANLAVLELPEVEEMFVFPSCGDESNSIGAACAAAAEKNEPIRPLGALYSGPEITDLDAEQALLPAARAKKLRFTAHKHIEQKTAAALAQGRIVARASGAPEFGARALGNRSILARADAPSLARALNEAVKCRDFWMPFAPSVLAERAADYYEKPKSVACPYMMFAFRSKPQQRAAFCGAQHPQDFTTRPHEVLEAHNPPYYRLLQEFEARTGQGILLNTSFNIHGEPIVFSAADAVDVFLRSGLEYMALGNFWVEKIA